MHSEAKLIVPYSPKQRNRKYHIKLFLSYSSLINFFIKNMATAFQKIGCNAEIVPENEYTNMTQRLYTYNDKKIKQCDFYISYNALNTEVSSLYDIAPLITVCIDRVYHLKNVRVLDIKNIIYTWISQQDTLNAHKYIKYGWHAFLPHASSILLMQVIFLIKKEKKIYCLRVLFIQIHFIVNILKNMIKE